MTGGTPLTEEQYLYLDETVTGIIRTQVIGRQLIAMAPGAPFGLGVQKVEWNQLQDMSDAIISMKLTENSDAIGYTGTSLNVPLIHKEFEIDRRDLLSSQRNGTPLDISNAMTAAEKVAAQEDTLLLVGSGNFNGLYNSVGNDYSTSADFGTAGNAIAAVKGGMALLLADKIKPPYNLVLNPEQYSEIVGPRGSYSDISELEIVRRMIQGGAGDGTPGAVGTGVGNIYVTDVITAGTGLLCATPNVRYADIALAQDVITEVDVLEKSKNLFGRVFEAMVPRIRVANAFCSLSAI